MYLLGYIDDAWNIYLQKMYLIPIDVHSIGILGVCHNDDDGNNHNDEDAIECWREGEKITALAGLWNPRQQLGRGPALMMMMMDGHGGWWTTAKIDHNHIQIMMELSFVWVTKTKLFPLWTWQFDRVEEKFPKHGEKKGDEMESALDDHWVGWEYSTVQDAPVFRERPQFQPLFWRKHQEHVIIFIDFFKRCHKTGLETSACWD